MSEGRTMTRHFCGAFVFTLLAVVGFAAPARASMILLPATGFIISSIFGPVMGQSGFPLQATGVTDGNTGAAALTASPNPAAYASLTGSGGVNQHGFVSAGLQYDFQINGPEKTLVPIFVQGSGYAKSSFGNQFFNGSAASLGISSDLSNTSILPLYSVIATAGSVPQGNTPNGRTNQNITFDDRILVPSNTPFEIGLGAEAEVDNGDNSKTPIESASAYIDPHLFIDPTFAGANEFSLQFSEGIDNSPVSATPLPPALSMFGAALLALGAFSWRRRGQRA
jgi:hypothetical protein